MLFKLTFTYLLTINSRSVKSSLILTWSLSSSSSFTLNHSNVNDALTLRECVGCWRRTVDTERLDHSTCISLSRGPALCLTPRLIITHSSTCTTHS